MCFSKEAEEEKLTLSQNSVTSTLQTFVWFQSPPVWRNTIQGMGDKPKEK